MKRIIVTLSFLLTTMAVGTGLKAQEITITLKPGWNWISYPNAVAMGLEEAFGAFVPEEGDWIKSVEDYSLYGDGEWGVMGDLEELEPGQGYMYFSSRTEVTSFVFAKPGSFLVTTFEPVDINSISARVGGKVIVDAGNHLYARGICWGTEPNPDVDGNRTVDGVVADSLTVILDGLTPSTTYYLRAYAVTDYGLTYGEERSFATLMDFDYVDLGLPSGLLWATCNVGASSPEGYGNYFAWGETQPKDNYTWETYQYSNGDYYNTLTKYCNDPSFGYEGFTDNLTVLLPEDDAATANWGEDWHTPTLVEWTELFMNTTCTWTSQNGVNGTLFTAGNGNSIFLPAAGYFGFNSDAVGEDGNYWSSSLCTIDPSTAWGFYLRNSCSVNGHSRCTGHSVRAVRSAPLNNTPTGAINGKFSVSAIKQVYFSQGNLQYQASTDTWRFAENQYDFIGDDNVNISEVYTGWIDLFCWGTSGWDCGNTYYHPWDWDNSNPALFGPPEEYDLTGEFANADWGVYNSISNGGNAAGLWRTLTYTEWYYLLYTRNTVSGIRYVKANVNGVDGLVLLPDDWDSDTFSISTANGFANNTLTDLEWGVLELSGAVFLPVAGVRFATSMGSMDSGRYWSASHYDSIRADYLVFYETGLALYTTAYRWQGQSVRLVQDVE